MSDDRTEEPTQKKLKDARKKGQVVRSKDLALAAATIAAVIALGRLGGRLVQGTAERLAADLAHFGDAPLQPIAAGELTATVAGAIIAIAVLVGPIALATMVVGVAAQGMQGGWNVSAEALHLDFGRLSPAKGIQQFKLTRSGLDTLKMTVVVAAIVWLTWTPVRELMADGPRLAWLSVEGSAYLGWTYLEKALWRVALLLGVMALADYGLQRYRVMSSLKMTKQEVRDEFRQQDGDPLVKSKVKRIQREMSRRRMMGAIKDATVVVTNPTHFAVALEYRRGEMAAPVVVAKGQDQVALQIRERARLYGVPIIEDKQLARALFSTTDIGEAIPAQLFAAVAEVLAQLIRLKRLVM